uniref:NADH-ubiquinone oxidoreductase chain 4L n=1 Tax=Trichonephila clavata TaxID=2740835 RepID=A0A060B9J1_TRICU|nr:NADH dehydrogenase subunit 4L [Trichonephila clavata]UQJ77488.1 NADH dehydrogenase subunit 4L [Trichonephila clavata]
MYIIKMMIFMSIMSMWWWRKNILLLLLSLEFLLISMYVLLIMNSYSFPTMSILFMLTILVSGSSLGLMLLVSMCRFMKSSNSSLIWFLL